MWLNGRVYGAVDYFADWWYLDSPRGRELEKYVLRQGTPVLPLNEANKWTG